MSWEEVESNSREIMKRLIAVPEYVRSGCIMLYWSCHNEVRTHELVRSALKEGKKVVLPRCDTKHRQIYPYRIRDVAGDLEPGAFGILEPKDEAGGLVDLSEIEMCIVPGIAFDPEGNRVGRGLGYYDRFLRGLDEKAKTIGLAYGFQIVNKIYPTDRDASMDKVVTQKGTLVTCPSVIK